MITEYQTKSGSVYEVDHDRKLVRRTTRSATSAAERVAEDWRPYAALTFIGVGTPLAISWGSGRDEHSANALQLGTEGVPDEHITRATVTTPVVAFAEARS